MTSPKRPAAAPAATVGVRPTGLDLGPDRRLRFAHQLVGDDPIPPEPSSAQMGPVEFWQLRLLDLDTFGQGYLRAPGVARAKERHRQDHVSLHVAALARAEERAINAFTRPLGRAVEAAEAVLGE